MAVYASWESVLNLGNQVFTANSTTFTIANDDDTNTVLFGTGFVYDAISGDLIGGTVNQILRYHPNSATTLISYTGLNASVTDLLGSLQESAFIFNEVSTSFPVILNEDVDSIVSESSTMIRFQMTNGEFIQLTGTNLSRFSETREGFGTVTQISHFATNGTSLLGQTTFIGGIDFASLIGASNENITFGTLYEALEDANTNITIDANYEVQGIFALTINGGSRTITTDSPQIILLDYSTQTQGIVSVVNTSGTGGVSRGTETDTFAGTGRYAIAGSEFDDQIYYFSTYGTVILGGGGDDVISITNALTSSILDGGDGNDQIIGGSADDIIDGGDGNDIIAYDSADTQANVTGGAGFDILLVVEQGPPITFNLVAQGFEQAQIYYTDIGGNPWQSVTQYYNTSWVQYYETVYNDDNSYRFTTWDVAGALPEAYYTDYFTAGAVWYSQRVVNDDSSSRNTTWDIENDDPYDYFTDYLNASNVVYAQRVVNDDGTSYNTTYDVENDDAYQYFLDAVNVANQVYQQDALWDNNNYQQTVFDVGNADTWASYVNLYDALGGNLIQQYFVMDDGSTVVIL